jgi:hypothetical protein
MEEKDTVENTIKAILEIVLRNKLDYHRDARVIHEIDQVYASPEEGVHLIHAFIRIKQPELRAAIIKLTTQLVDD